MARTSMKSMLLQLRQRISAVLEHTNGRPAQVPTSPYLTKLAEPREEKKQVYRMRDPLTGFWEPKNHFLETDPAELRAKLIPKKD